jgi:hypothetical protein
MGFLGKAAKGALAAKVVSEARKPHNQRRARNAFSSLRARLTDRRRPGTAR